MDFAWLPPEVNSALMYAGPGAGPLLAAAAGWATAAADLHSAAAGYQSVVTGLTSHLWLGPSSAVMAASISPYVGWLQATAAQAERTSMQVNAAAAAYETAFAATVPPPVVLANRAQLAVLVATNLLGQNTAAIATNEALYAEMWAQDAAAMYTYSAAVTPLATDRARFGPPPEVSNPFGPGNQLGAAAQRALAEPMSAALTASQPLAAPQAVPSPAAAITIPGLGEFEIPDLLGLDLLALTGATASITGAAISAAAWASAVPDVQKNQRRLTHLHDENVEFFDILGHPRPDSMHPGDWPPWVEGDAPWPEAYGGEALSVGNLSVPPAWAAAAPEIRTVGYPLPSTGADAAPAGAADPSGTTFSQMALAGLAGRALAGTLGGSRADGIPLGIRKPAKPAESSTEEAPPERRLTGIAAELRELAKLRDTGVLTQEEFLEQKRRLLS